MMTNPPRLTAFSHGAGCACKLSPADLAQVLAQLPPPAHPDLLVGPETRDDAAAYRLTPDLAIVLTADFITPVVDDAVDYGAIAATNAISDIYAMGGQPLLALNLVGFPRDALDLSVLQEILSAGAAVAHEAGMLVVGGHTIDDPELKYGMSVVGTVHPDRVVRNTGGRAGDVLYLTKSLGVGILTTAAKRDAIDNGGLAPAVSSMRRSNRDASRAMVAAGVLGATDVTGFGLLGHLNELAAGSGVAAEVVYADLPVLPLVEGLAREGVVPGGTQRNLDNARGFTEQAEGIADWQMLVAADAQTSGGLLLAVAPGNCERLEAEMLELAVPAVRVGQLLEGTPGQVRVR
ncbi:MAG: selenide, water dikinase SelD [Candidatus Dormibacteria bacterium]